MASRETGSLPQFPIGPVLEYYGGQPVDEDRGWYDYPCPFHGDRSASASVRTVDEQVFNCHACQISGNAVQLIMKQEGTKQEGLKYWDAVRRAEEITGGSGVRLSGGRGSGSPVPGQARTWQGYSHFRKTWLRDEPDDSGTQEWP